MFLENDSAELLLAKMVDRTVSFSYSSLLFLKSHGFQFDHAFQHGVCYLSRQEEADANGLFRQNGGGQALDEHVDIDAQDEEAREFYSSAKNQISSWLDDPDSVRSSRFDSAIAHETDTNLTRTILSTYPTRTAAG